VALGDFHQVSYRLTRVEIVFIHQQRRRVVDDIGTPVPAHWPPASGSAVPGHV
jgi:hypothetical protein